MGDPRSLFDPALARRQLPLGEAIEARMKLENDIRELLRQFHEKTGLWVQSIEMDDGILTDVRVEVRL